MVRVSTVAVTSAAAAPVAIIATPARMARSMTAWAVTESTPSGVVQMGISSVGGPLGLMARRVLALSEGRLRWAVVGRAGRSVRATPRPYATAPVPGVPHRGARQARKPGSAVLVPRGTMAG